MRRHIPLHGCENFRDLGGYASPLGETAWGVAFRAGSLSRLSPADIEVLRALQIRTILDLRSPAEVLAAGEGPHGVLGAQRLHASLLPRHRDLRPTLDYADWIALGSEPLAAVFSLLCAEQDPFPVVFHCSAGKDRTGIVAALLLSLAEVPRAQIVADYALTQQHFRPLDDPESEKRWRREVLRFFPGISTAISRRLLDAEPATMETFLDELHARYGGVIALLDHLGITRAQQARLRARLLRP